MTPRPTWSGSHSGKIFFSFFFFHWLCPTYKFVSYNFDVSVPLQKKTNRFLYSPYPNKLIESRLFRALVHWQKRRQPDSVKAKSCRLNKTGGQCFMIGTVENWSLYQYVEQVEICTSIHVARQVIDYLKCRIF